MPTKRTKSASRFLGLEYLNAAATSTQNTIKSGTGEYTSLGLGASTRFIPLSILPFSAV